VEDQISRTVGAVLTKDGASNFIEDPDNDATDRVFDIGNMSKRIIASIKVASHQDKHHKSKQRCKMCLKPRLSNPKDAIPRCHQKT
jgi:hypothetical protein